MNGNLFLEFAVIAMVIDPNQMLQAGVSDTKHNYELGTALHETWGNELSEDGSPHLEHVEQ
ncbi:hypothetical protein DS906_20565 [Ruegeria sp. A3M17]|nr:hypothetical protein DS906_20565 [Ruegeria sp. A3M17]